MNVSPEGPQMNFELPPQPGSAEIGEDKRQEKGQEAPAARPEQVGKQSATPALPVIPDDIPTADAPVIAVPVQDGTATALVVDHPAGDTERIEPVWVDKAKQIIAQTQDDPYTQKNQMSKIKAEYIQKRFNKQIKTDEAPA